MPNLDEISISREKKSFKKRDYRPWNLEGNFSKNPDITDNNHPYKVSSQSDFKEVIEVNCSLIKNWDYHDRPENELGNIESLANEFREIGQLQPCIVRPLHNNDSYKYELIVGERRWRAAQLADVPLKVTIKELSDSEAAIIQASENYNRQDLSDYARGINYARFIEEGIITPAQLTKTLGISRQQISRLLSFNKIPKVIIDAIQDMSKVSARTAEHIKQLCNKGEDYVVGIIKYADKLRAGQIGHEKLTENVERFVNNSSNSSKVNDKLYSRDGIHLFTLKNSGKASPSLHFNKDIITLLEKRNINLKSVALKISQVIEESLING